MNFTYSKYIFLILLFSFPGIFCYMSAGCPGEPVKKYTGLLIMPDGLNDSSFSTNSVSPARHKLFKPTHTPIINLIFYATGRFPGMRVSMTGAGIAGSSIATIRGYRYFYHDNQPLYVIDGLPVTNLGHNSVEVSGESDNDFGDGIADFNPDDIESLEVLSGPEAISKFGPRGLNGVVLINTRSNYKKRGIGVEFNTGIVCERITHFPDFQNYYATGFMDTDLDGKLVEVNGTTYETLEPDSYFSWGPPLDGRRTVIDPFVYPEDKNKKLLTLRSQPADNIKNFYQNGMYFSNTLAITGSAKKTDIRFSVSDRKYNGTVPGYAVDRQALSFKSHSTPFSFLTAGVNFNYIHTKGDNSPNMGDNIENLGFEFATMARYVPLKWLQEYYGKTGEAGVWPGIGYNPYYLVNELKNTNNKDRITGYLTINARIFNWLNFGAEWGIDSYVQDWKKQWPIGALNPGMVDNSTGRIIVQKNKVSDINSALHLDFDYSLKNDISFTGSLGANLLKQQRDLNNTDGRIFIDEDIYELSNCRIQDKTYSKGDHELSSFSFQGGISVKSVLNVGFSAMSYHIDEVNNDAHLITTITSGFVFSRLFRNLNASGLSYGNIRLSWSAAEDNNNFAMLYDGIPGQSIKKNRSKSYGSSLSWETGFDLGFFNNRIQTDLTYYYTGTKNQTVPLSMSPASGYSYKVINMGHIINKGIEAEISVAALKRSAGLNWSIGLLIARNYSEIEDLVQPATAMTVYGSGVYDVQLKMLKGQPFGSIVASKYRRSPGGERIVKSNGTYALEPSISEVGDICPDWTGSVNNSFTYKRWSVGFLVDFVQGNQIFSEPKSLMNEFGTGRWTTEGRRVKDMDDNGNQLPLTGVLPGVIEIANPQGQGVIYEPNTLAVDGQTYWRHRAGEDFIMDASFIRLEEMEISYKINLQKNKSKLSIPLRIALIGRNLFTLDQGMGKLGSSPESVHSTATCEQGFQVLSLPPVRTLGICLEISL